MERKRFCCTIELLADVSCYSVLAFADPFDWNSFTLAARNAAANGRLRASLYMARRASKRKYGLMEAGVDWEMRRGASADRRESPQSGQLLPSAKTSGHSLKGTSRSSSH